MAQRLVRRVCRQCAEEYEPDSVIRAEFPAGFDLPPGGRLVRGRGCRACRNTGYRGRLGVYELLRITDAIRAMVMERVNAPNIAARARADGDLSTLLDDGFEKVRNGLTTLHEVASAISG